MKRLFIGNLPFKATEVELRGFFEEAGFQPESVNVMRDKFSGQTRGFGFVEIGDDEQANRAIAACNGQDFMGRAVLVNEARPMTERKSP